jgi:flagellar hook-associated protein 1 FlgK
MSTTFLSYYVANRAMETSQVSINTTGNNISNINTDGYTRQRADIVSLYSSSNSRYANTTVRAGLGAKATGISQIRDPYLDTRYRLQNSEANRYASIAESLTSLEDVIDEASTEALQGQLTNFLSDLESLEQSPTSADIQTVVRSSAGKVVTMLNTFANDIDGVLTEQIEEMDNTINNDVNVILQNIAQLNQQIREELVYGNSPNELYDSRNLLVDELSGYANIKVSTSAQVITDDLSIQNYVISIEDEAGTAIQLVNNEYYNQLKGQADADGLYQITIDGNSKSISDPTATNTAMNNAGLLLNDYDAAGGSYITQGTLSGLLDFVNGAGSFAAATATTGDTDFAGIQYYMKALDDFAQQFANVFNTYNDITGTLYDDADESPLFTSDTPATGDITAKNIQISQQWQSDPSFINTTTNTINVGQADNVTQMIEAMDKDFTYPNGFTGNFHEYMNAYLGELSNDVEMNNNFSKTSGTVLDTLFTSRESVSGVSLNEEGTYLMAYQKCYNAAVRFFTVIDENVDRIINSMGRAGL